MNIPYGGSQSEITVEYATDDWTINKLTGNELTFEAPDIFDENETVLVFGTK